MLHMTPWTQSWKVKRQYARCTSSRTGPQSGSALARHHAGRGPARILPPRHAHFAHEARCAPAPVHMHAGHPVPSSSGAIVIILVWSLAAWLASHQRELLQERSSKSLLLRWANPELGQPSGSDVVEEGGRGGAAAAGAARSLARHGGWQLEQCEPDAQHSRRRGHLQRRSATTRRSG
jgi:hypothetical protein